jgi:hypothetical protein
MHSWVYIYFTCFHDLLLFKFVVVCRSRKSRAKENKNDFFFSFSENEANKRFAKKKLLCVCGERERDHVGTWRERRNLEPLRSFNIPAAVIFMMLTLFLLIFS